MPQPVLWSPPPGFETVVQQVNLHSLARITYASNVVPPGKWCRSRTPNQPSIPGAELGDPGACQPTSSCRAPERAAGHVWLQERLLEELL